MASRKLVIGFVFDDSLDRNDGVQQYIKALANYLHNRGHEVHYLVGETKHADGFPGTVHSLSKNVSVAGNKNRMSIPLPASKSHTRKVLSDIKPDVLHVQMPFSPFLGAKVINLAAKTTAVVATFHIVGERAIERYGSHVLQAITAAANKRINRFLSVSEPAAIYAKKHYHVDSTVLPNVVDLEKFRSAKAKRTKSPTILFLGRLVERKGADLLLKAVVSKQAELNRLNVHVVIAGDGPMRASLEAFVAKHRLGNMVEFLGYIDESDKPGLLASADLAVFPSTGGESFGIVLIEAMATNGPIILAGNNQGYSSVVGAQPMLVVDPNNSEQMGARIIKLLKDQQLRSQLKAWQNQRVQDFAVNTVGAKLETIYYRTIKEGTNDS